MLDLRSERLCWALSRPAVRRQQRVEIARVLGNRPRLLLMDEPFGALDALTRLRRQELLLDIWEQFRKTVLFVTHDIDEALLLADQIIVMQAHPGRIHDETTVPFERPRMTEIIESGRFMRLKQRRLHMASAEFPSVAGALGILRAFGGNQYRLHLNAPNREARPRERRATPGEACAALTVLLRLRHYRCHAEGRASIGRLTTREVADYSARSEGLNAQRGRRRCLVEVAPPIRLHHQHGTRRRPGAGRDPEPHAVQPGGGKRAPAGLVVFCRIKRWR